MTRTNFTKKIKSSFVLILTIVSLLCVSLFGLFACDDKKTSDVIDPSTYTTTKTSTSLINNSDFTDKADTQNFSKDPIITTVTGWSRNEDNAGGRTSRVNSGVIDISDGGWESLLKYLYDDVEFNDYMKTKYGYDNDSIKEEIKSEKNNDQYNASLSEIKAYVIKNYYDKFLNPGKYSNDATDNNIYMLNNYLESTYYGIGTSQKIVSNSVALDKDSYYEVSVWVKTANIKSNNADGNYGANIRLISNVGGKPQEDVKIVNITNEDWTNYKLYLKTDVEHVCTVSLNIGLGFGNGNYYLANQFTEGTLYVDGISFTKLENTPNTSNCEVVNLKYASNEPININTKEVSTNEFLYNMIVVAPTGYFNSLSTNNLKGDYTSKKFDYESFSYTNNGTEYTAKLENTSATIRLSSDKFVVNSENYVYVSFELKADFSKYGSSNITIDVYDILGDNVKKRPALTTINNVGEYEKYGITIKNNFKNVDNRKFYIDIVVGPTAVSDVVAKYEYATCDLAIKNIQYSTGEVLENTENYDFYSLYSANSIINSSLYAGSSADYSETHTHSESFIFTTNPGNIGDIINYPTDASGYDGIVSNHIFINDQNTPNVVTEANTRSGRYGDGNGNYAGLINSDYISNYNITNLSESLAYNGEKAIQPLMIYNSTNDHYGFISTGSKSISSNNFAKISLKVRVVGDAKAYIYLINNNTETKDVIKFKNFTTNTDEGYMQPTTGTSFNASDLLLQFCIDKEVMNKKSADGWVEVTFFIATGVTPMDFRIELWNGGRDGEDSTASTGFVFFDNLTTTISASAFSEPSNWKDAFSVSGNPLYELTKNGFEETDTLVTYKRELTELEKKFNKEYPSQKVSYDTKYVWAKTSNFLYAIYNNIDVKENNPYDSITEETKESCNSGCTATTDPSTFWLSFSSIVLGAILFLAILALIIKNILRKNKANASDAKSHYKVTSRIKTHNSNVQKLTSKKIEDEEIEESVEEETTEQTDDNNLEEKDLDSYVYGEVEEFDSNQTEENSEDKE